MLIEFRVENHRSILEEQALTMEAAPIGDSDDKRPRLVKGHDKKLLPVAVLYGANASGKSNVLSAIAFMRNCVMNSQRLGMPGGGIPRTPFAWSGGKEIPSLFEVTFLQNDTKFAYGFLIDDEIVLEEWLFAWPNKRKQTWFERDGDKFKFGESLKGQNETVREVTRSNALFLSAAAQMGHQFLTERYSWFQNIECGDIYESGYPRHSIQYMLEKFASRGTETSGDFSQELIRQKHAKNISHLLKTADFGVIDFKQVDETETYADHTYPRQRMKLKHQSEDNSGWLYLEEESEGTQKVFKMAPWIFNALESGGVLLIDELEASLHPLLGLAIMSLFNSPETNPKNAQLIFTTHDTNILGPVIRELPLRRDQVWFTQKNDDGATKLYPLTDYKPRKAENLERGYLQGRYGAIPFLGDMNSIVE